MIILITITIIITIITILSDDWMLRLALKHEKNYRICTQNGFISWNCGETSNMGRLKNTESAWKLKRTAKEEGKKAINTDWKSKSLHGQYPLQSQKADVDLHDTHQWLVSARLKSETEGFIIATQDQNHFLRNFQANILLNGADLRCRFFNTSTNTIYHLISGCTILAPNEYTNRHNHVRQYIQWKICYHYDIETPNKWYEHKSLSVMDTPKVTILWDFSIRTDGTIQAKRPDAVIKHKRNKTCQLIDINVPSYSNISAKEFEKLSK